MEQLFGPVRGKTDTANVTLKRIATYLRCTDAPTSGSESIYMNQLWIKSVPSRVSQLKRAMNDGCYDFFSRHYLRYPGPQRTGDIVHKLQKIWQKALTSILNKGTSQQLLVILFMLCTTAVNIRGSGHD